MAENMGIKKELFDLIIASVTQAPYYQLLGVRLEQIGSGWATLTVMPQTQHTNPIGLVHGGLIMSLGDAAMGNAVRSLGLKGVTANMNIDFMRPAKVESKLLARGDVTKAGSNLVFARAVIESDNKLIAATSGTFYVTGAIDLEVGSHG
ncbi:MAG: PaaI family thioesterase [Methylocystaceae bacterium]